MNNYGSISLARSQRGIVLFMSLVMLLIITVLGISSVQTTSLQERMARNARDSNLAFQAAESALKDAEVIVEALTSLAQFNAASATENGLFYEADYDAVTNWSQINWADASGNYMTAATNIEGIASPPKFIIEHLKTVVSDVDSLNQSNIGQSTGSARTQIFRVTVYGTGGSDTAHLLIQGTYGKVF
ncbi:MAG: hypothetical protein KUG79_19220 [Pseudomonadales bacterium]|nr:hypothetical protein [Pseudomonadales bacterium]